MMDWGDSGGWSWWWMLPTMTFMLVLIGSIMWGVVAFVRTTTSSAHPIRPTADDILNERFARGEIDASEYDERVAALHGAPPGAKI
jgi:putative membrane protein